MVWMILSPLGVRVLQEDLLVCRICSYLLPSSSVGSWLPGDLLKGMGMRIQFSACT